jgi:hypothetical protein
LGEVGLSKNPKCSGRFEKPGGPNFVQMGVAKLIQTQLCLGKHILSKA